MQLECEKIRLDVINEVRRLYFGGALLFALFFEKVCFLVSHFLRKTHIFEVMSFVLSELAAQ